MLIFQRRLFTRRSKLFLAIGLLSTACSFNAIAGMATTETQKYLVIATGAGNNFEAFDMDGGELGADQEVVSSGSGANGGVDYQGGKKYTGGQIHRSYTSIGIDLTGTFVSEDGKGEADSDNRWEDIDPDHVNGDTVGVSDYLKGARSLTESPDYSGNVALTGAGAVFTSENTDYFANLGIHCNNTAEACNKPNDDSDSTNDNSWKKSDTDDFVDMEEGSGVSSFDPAALTAELANNRAFINSLAVEETINFEKIDNQNYKDSGSPFTTNLDLIDTDMDGYAVIDIALEFEKDFLVGNTDWILQTDRDVVAIFRMKNGGNFLFTNSSIMMGCVTNQANCHTQNIDHLGAIFYTDNSKGNQAFNVNNVILGGIGLWDLDDDRDTKITLNNVQGCTQLISSRVELSSKERLNRCSFPKVSQVPEPSTIILFSLALFGLSRTRIMTAT